MGKSLTIIRIEQVTILKAKLATNLKQQQNYIRFEEAEALFQLIVHMQCKENSFIKLYITIPTFSSRNGH